MKTKQILCPLCQKPMLRYGEDTFYDFYRCTHGCKEPTGQHSLKWFELKEERPKG